MEKLVRNVVLGLLTLTVGLFVVQLASAQEKSMGGEKKKVTGCLQKGDEAGEYSITGEDGKTYGLRSNSVDLSQHLGHKVSVTGTLRPESAEKDKGESAEQEKAEHEKKGGAEVADIRVTDVKMVSEKCQ